MIQLKASLTNFSDLVTRIFFYVVYVLDFSPVIFQSSVCVLLTALVFARLLPVKDVLYCAFLSSTLSPLLFALVRGKSPPEWISSHLLNQALLSFLVSLICIGN